MPDRVSAILIEKQLLHSTLLQRDVIIDCYLPAGYNELSLSLLLINDGQDLRTMAFEDILEDLFTENNLQPLLCAGIHCATDRKSEYGTADILDYKGRGAKAGLYSRFIFEELIPWLRKTYSIISFKEKAFAGFSLGGLCALDIAWNHPEEFTKVGVFSGSLWWRDKDQDENDFDENTDRIMHRQIREGNYKPWLKFFFEVGTLDEKADRNNNGIIDSIDDTMSLIKELEKKGYSLGKEIQYLEIKDGKHDVPTWARAFPAFLEWGWGEEIV
ncbi:MAG TPA: alpha/beta hydrolase-fold protein [Ferruginibacter sp.]|nr:alpha/beta hydrolase-fold protein [Ferruginibacter sp.]